MSDLGDETRTELTYPARLDDLGYSPIEQTLVTLVRKFVDERVA